MKRIAFVVQRYGLEVNGGAELHCRWVAEHLSQYFEVHVITTCALDYMSWNNYYLPGESTLNNVVVHRFQVERPRNLRRFNRLSKKVFSTQHMYFDELEWMKQQGPYVPELLQYLQESKTSYSAFIFFTYLYFTTFFGIQIVPERSLLVPTAHDEAPIYLSLFRPIFHLPRFFIYNTEAEKQFVERLFSNQYIPNVVVGTGIEVPNDIDGERFRAKYGIEGDFILYVGRIDQSKNCHELFEYFARFKQSYSETLRLILIGRPGMRISVRPDVLPLGFVSEQDKFDALKAAAVVVIPSRYESLSMVNLEAWLTGTPVLVNGSCEVLRENCVRANGGLWYQNYEEFEAALTLLLGDTDLRKRLAVSGMTYASSKYAWKVVEQQYLHILGTLLAELDQVFHQS